jgi:hypothetical protein
MLPGIAEPFFWLRHTLFLQLIAFMLVERGMEVIVIRETLHAGFKATGHAEGVVFKRIDVDPELAEGIFPLAQSVRNDLQVGPAALAKPLRLYRLATAFWTEHFASD